MTITTTCDNGKLYAKIQGRVDTSTVHEVEQTIKKDLDNATELILDFAELDYISSAGLRLLLSLLKIMQKKGSMKIVNVNSFVMEIFEVTGFNELLTIE